MRLNKYLFLLFSYLLLKYLFYKNRLNGFILAFELSFTWETNILIIGIYSGEGGYYQRI